MLACLAMVVNKPFEELWDGNFRQKIEDAKGIHGENLEKAFQLAGLTRDTHYKTIWVGQLIPRLPVLSMLWKRRALIQVPSLNVEGAWHVVYWDGTEVFDPSTKQVYRWLDQLVGAEHIWLFNEVDG
jgi:hypothetical protein